MNEHRIPSPPAGQAETTPPPREPSQQAVARLIADRLGETEAQARRQIVRTVQTLGRTQSLTLLEETMQIEASGGMLLPDGSRRRTPGGVFFLLVRTKGRPKEHPWLKRTHTPVRGDTRDDGAARTSETRSKPHPPEALPPLPWAERLTVLAEIEAESGRLPPDRHPDQQHCRLRLEHDDQEAPDSKTARSLHAADNMTSLEKRAGVFVVRRTRHQRSWLKRLCSATL